MARPKKELTQVEENVSEVELLRRQVAEMKELLSQALGNKVENKSTVESKAVEEEEDTFIRMDKQIRVMSLCPYTLNLTTKPKGAGKIFSFDKLFSVKNILYVDLADIMENHPSFVENGFFYILDEKVIKRHNLGETYSKLLNKEKIEKIINVDAKEAVDLFKSANATQRGLIVEVLINKLANKEELDLNVISVISRLAKVDILAKAGVNDSEEEENA